MLMLQPKIYRELDFCKLKVTFAYMRARAVFQRSAGKGVEELLFGDLPNIFLISYFSDGQQDT